MFYYSITFFLHLSFFGFWFGVIYVIFWIVNISFVVDLEF